jgi:putative FmdB family regulatory protein
MPLYEYNCPEHGKFEAHRPMRVRETANCPKCGQLCDKVMSTCNWSFGWRISDRSMNEKWTPRDELVRNI